jgi:hypothetical protein
MFGDGCFGKLSDSADADADYLSAAAAGGGESHRHRHGSSGSKQGQQDAQEQQQEHAQCEQMPIRHGFGNRSAKVSMQNCALGHFPLPEAPDPAVACRAACCANSACRSWGLDVKHPGNGKGCSAGKPCCWLERCSGLDAEHLTNCSWGCVSGQAGRADDPAQCGQCKATSCESCAAVGPPGKKNKTTVAHTCKGGFDGEQGAAGYGTPYLLRPILVEKG